MNVVHSLLSSIHAGQDRLAKVARTVASGSVPTAAGASDRVDLSRAAVEMLQTEHQVAAGARALARAAEAQDAFLDDHRK
jgi:hypothetical protein